MGNEAYSGLVAAFAKNCKEKNLTTHDAIKAEVNTFLTNKYGASVSADRIDNMTSFLVEETEKKMSEA